MLEINVNGQIKAIKTDLFAALDGWDMQRRFVEFAASTDPDVRRKYTMDVLAYAKVVAADGHEIPLSTPALIDNHLGTWQNLQTVFDEVLARNGINPNEHANKSHFWAKAGEEMAIAFIAEASKLIGPAMEMMAEQNKQG